MRRNSRLRQSVKVEGVSRTDAESPVQWEGRCIPVGSCCNCCCFCSSFLSSVFSFLYQEAMVHPLPASMRVVCLCYLFFPLISMHSVSCLPSSRSCIANPPARPLPRSFLSSNIFFVHFVPSLPFLVFNPAPLFPSTFFSSLFSYLLCPIPSFFLFHPFFS